MIKSPEEQAFIRDAGQAHRLSPSRPRTAAPRPGKDRERSVAHARAGVPGPGVHGGGLVQFGPSAALPHGGPGDRRLAPGDVVLIDAGCKVRGYNSDVTRTVCFGTPSDEVRKVYGVVDRAQLAGIEALRAGAAPRGRRPRRAAGHRGGGLRRVLHAPPRPRARHGRPRAPLPRPRQRRAARRPATPSRSSPESTCPASSASASRTTMPRATRRRPRASRPGPASSSS